MPRVFLVLVQAVMLTLTAWQPPQASTPAPAPAKAEPSLHYLDAASIAQLETTLPDPPAERGAISRGEGDLMLAMRAEATPAAMARAKSEENFRPWNFADVLGPGFSRERMPLTDALLRHAEEDSAVVSRALKAKWTRKRPPVQDERITAVLGLPKDGSYPSGHAVRAMMWAHILALLAPDQEQALLQRSRLVAYDRVIGGVHYPTDVAAGLTVGGLIADELAKSPAFQADLAKARAEWPPHAP